MKVIVGVQFDIVFHWVTCSWRRTLANGSDVKYVFPLANGSDVKYVFPPTNWSNVKYVFPLTNASDVYVSPRGVAGGQADQHTVRGQSDELRAEPDGGAAGGAVWRAGGRPGGSGRTARGDGGVARRGAAQAAGHQLPADQAHRLPAVQVRGTDAQEEEGKTPGAGSSKPD